MPKKHLDIFTPIKETTADSTLGIHIRDEDLREITVDDDDPRFVVVDFEEGTSNNNVTYDRDFFVRLAEQINTKQPPGYLGHKHTQGLDKEDLLPDPQVVWLAAAVHDESGKAMLTTKGYLIPASEGGKARAWLKRRAINSVSWVVDAMLTLGKDGKYRVKDFALESIDFARKGREGVRNQRLRVVTEMEGGDLVVDGESAQDIASKLTIHELQTYNPGLVTAIKEMGKDEVKSETATAVAAKEDELNTKHQQELEKNPDITMMQRVKELLGISDDPNAKADDVISTILARLDEVGQQIVESWFKTEVLEKKITDEKARKLVSRLIPIKEMVGSGDLRSERGIEKVKKDLEDKADDMIDSDPEVQVILKEMASNRGGFNFGSSSKDGDRRRDDNNDDDGPKENSNLRVEKVRVG